MDQVLSHFLPALIVLYHMYMYHHILLLLFFFYFCYYCSQVEVVEEGSMLLV